MRSAITSRPAQILAPAGEVAEVYRPTIDNLSLGVPRQWATPVTAVAATAALLAHLFIAHPYYTFGTLLCSGVEAAVAVILLARYVARRPPRLPWLELIYLVHYTQFGLGTTVAPSLVGALGVTPRPESHESAAILGLFSGFALIAAFAVTATVTRRVRANPLMPHLDAETLVAGSNAYIIVSAVYVVATTVAPSLRPGASANLVESLFGYWPLTATAAVAFLARPRGSTRFGFVVALGAIGVTLAVTSMIGGAVIPLVGVAVLWWRARERIPLAPVIGAIAIMVVLQPVKAHYRALQWSQHADLGLVDAWTRAFEAADSDQQSGWSAQGTGADLTRQRMSELSGTAFVLDVVPLAVPYSGGEVYEVLLYSLIPRVVWPEKPNMTKLGLDQVTIALGLADRDMTEYSTTGISLTSHGFYAHGVAGSLGWMALLGIVLALLALYFGPTIAGTLGGSVVMMMLVVAIGGGFINTFGGVLQAVAAATSLTWVLRWIGVAHMRMRHRPPALSSPRP